jgi:hypothetical protein
VTFDSVKVTKLVGGSVTGTTGTFSGALAGASINTGLGAFEVGQSTATTDDVTFDSVKVTKLVGGSVTGTTGTFSGALSVSQNASSVFLGLNNSSATPRWSWQLDGTETTNDTGSNILLVSYNDAGSAIDNVLKINRKAGMPILTTRPFTSSGALAGTTINTGLGAFEVGQSTATTDDVTFDSVKVTKLVGGSVTGTTGTFSGTATVDSLSSTKGIRATTGTFSSTVTMNLTPSVAFLSLRSSSDVVRWSAQLVGSETTNDTGSNLRLVAYTDAGVAIDQVFNIGRMAGAPIITPRPITAVATYSSTVGATNRDLYVDNAGVIGYVSSTRESKDSIREMSSTDWLYRLKPVEFYYKKDSSKGNQWGLIAEEADSVRPEMVYKDSDGKVEGFDYGKLVPALLNEIQRLNERLKILEAK